MPGRFIFTDNQDGEELENSFKGFVRTGISDVDELLNELADSLKFPEYYGENWNALSDCLRDFHWVEEKRVFLIHEDIPSINDDDLNIYIEILFDAVGDWKEGEDHELFVIFPAPSEGRVRGLLG